MPDYILEIGADGRAILNLDGGELLGPLVAQATQAAEDAAAAIDQIQAVAAKQVIQGRSETLANAAGGTQYRVQIPAAFEPLPNGALIDVLITETNVGPPSLQVGNLPARDVFMVRGQALRANWISRFEKNDGGGKWNLVTQFPQGVDLLDVNDNALGGIAIARAAIGGDVGTAVAVGGDPNYLSVRSGYPGWNDNAEFDVLIPATNTGPVTFALPDGRIAFVSTGGGVIGAGALVGGQVTRFAISTGGGALVNRGSRPLATLDGRQSDPWAAAFNEPIANPYGYVQQGGDGRPAFTIITNRFVGRGSSVSTDAEAGREGAAPPGQAPVAVMADEYTRSFGPWLKGKADNFSHGGHVAAQAEGQWGEAMAADGSPVDVLFDCFGMNDMAPSSYNAGQVTPYYLGNPIYYEAEIRRRLDGGVKTFVGATSPHTHTGRLTNSFGGNPMQYPYNKPAPVAEEELVPPFSKAVTEPLDWTGGGVLRPGDRRGGHTNLLIRDVIRRLHYTPRYRGRVFLLDVEWAWFRYGVEVYSLDDLFNPGEVVHPNLLGHQVSYQRCIKQFVAAMRRGCGDQWSFRGDG